MRLLIVEDHEVLAAAIAAGLRREGMAVNLARHGQEALDRLAGTRYDVAVLDRDLPSLHGDEVAAPPVSTTRKSPLTPSSRLSVQGRFPVITVVAIAGKDRGSGQHAGEPAAIARQSSGDVSPRPAVLEVNEAAASCRAAAR